MVGRLYLEHLSDADLALLSSAGEPARAVHPDPERIEALIDSPALFRVLFGTPGRDPLLRASPFLLFAVLIHRATRDLGAASFVEEWVGPRQRVPVFDVAGLREFGADPLRRAYRVAQQATDRSAAMAGVLAELSENFAIARRVLNFVTDRYLFPMRQRRFGAG